MDREFGTGAVKITPAHDFNDFEAGERHQLPRIALLTHQALLNPETLRDAGVEQEILETIADLPAIKARPIVVDALKDRETSWSKPKIIKWPWGNVIAVKP